MKMCSRPVSASRRRPAVVPLMFAASLAMVAITATGCKNGAGIGFGGSDGEGKVSFEREIKPIFASNCVRCHMGVAPSERGGMAPDFRTRKGALAEYAGGQLIVPGSSADSRLFRVVTSHEYGTMPPTGHVLSLSQVALLKRWIDQGAPWPEGESGVITPMP